ncbi:hypothetical protein GCM10012285_28200 [Streptomyces kronopolitis]|uniref:Uncharacterized protein n=1 Tax=Streptomyces kronopolitis TaxID=1612435 RepID=A0ABQ2JGV6_9ACTN|nr:hypothetical protein GCM10012285_28200 [Streptomyces kronopolitis]
MNLTDLHRRLLADILTIGTPYPLVITGGYAHVLVCVAHTDVPSQPVQRARSAIGRTRKITHPTGRTCSRVAAASAVVCGVGVSPRSAGFTREGEDRLPLFPLSEGL